jgi:glycosyltransferase involved in cell wall biosynthesis
VTTALDRLIADDHPLARDLDLEIVAPKAPREPLALSSIPMRVVPEFTKPRLPQFWVQLQLPFQIRGGLISFCNLGPVAARHHIVCIHDLHTRLAARSYGWGFRLAHRLLLPILGRRARAVATVSQFSCEHLVRFGVVPDHKLIVTYNGHEHALRWNPDASQLRLASGRPFVLCLGRAQEYKNNALLWRLARPLDRMGIDLYVAGDLGASAGPQLEVGQAANIRLLGRISDDDFAKALNAALCFLFPSRLEGFGLPAIEAMARGCPVVASSAACFPEVCSDAALLASPDDDAAWIRAIEQLRDDSHLRTVMVQKGRRRARDYSWEAIAETYLALMARADARLSEPAPLPVRTPAAGYGT